MTSARSLFFSAPATISGRRRRAVVHDDDERQRRRRRRGRAVASFTSCIRIALADGLHDDALREEEVGDLDRLLEEAARVAAQVEDEPLQPAARLRAAAA